MDNPQNVQRRKRKLKEKKRDGPNRKARLIIRNLPFTSTEDNLREYFSKFGQIDEVKLLLRPDGKLVGCGFIQFHAVQMAAKAMYNTTGKPFMGRPIICDWAVPKNKFVEQMQANDSKNKKNETETIKEEVLSDNEVNVNNTNVDIKEESGSDNEKDEIKSESDESGASNSNSDISDLEDNEGNESETNIVNDDNDVNPVDEDEPKPKRQRVESNDVSEGRTVFIKNIPFTATNEDLKECMSQFGRVLYALICVDPLTEHSKGSGFVKFVEKEDADKCLQAGTELSLMGNILDCHEALDRKTIQDKKNKKKIKVKDSRNLYLVKEGVVIAGTKAAEGISAADMAKRLQLEQWKTHMLRNLNMFVSRERLIIHNLPASWDDTKLKMLIKKHVSSNAVIREARVMRDMKNLDSKGVGKSKEFGFVSFTNHEDALTALRSLNNNPNIFNPNRRPIVAFSIENKVVINSKQRRLQKSKLRNPHCKEYDATVSKEKKDDKSQTHNNNRKQKHFPKSNNTSQEKPYLGIISKPGNKQIGKKHNLKRQAQIHFENLKKEKNEKKKKRLLQTKKNDHIRQPRQKVGKRKQEKDNFSKIESKFIKPAQQKVVKKKKWYN